MTTRFRQFWWQHAVGLIIARTALGQDWTLTSAPATNWSSIACSADGAFLVAAGGRLRPHRPGDSGDDSAPIWISTNAGADWAMTAAPILPWQCVASSADGRRLVAVSAPRWPVTTNGCIYTSTNSGITWISNSAPAAPLWTSVASSADGLKLVAATSTGRIYTSANGGASWQLGPASLSNWVWVASSADGTRLIAVDSGDFVHAVGGIYISTNSGAWWQRSTAPGGAWAAVASSADGNRLAAAAYMENGFLCLSTNAGLTWSTNSLPAGWYYSLASSADGRAMVAASGRIHVTTDYGATWTSNVVTNAYWYDLASSADGARLAGVTDQGILMCRLTTAPRLEVAHRDDNLQLSWIVPSTNYLLQVSSTSGNSDWSDAPVQPTLDLTKLQYHVPVAPTNDQGYFRLRTQ